MGFGTPSKRERQYKQVRVAKATEAVYEHRKMQHGHDETSLVNLDKAQARKIKIRFFLHYYLLPLDDCYMSILIY